MTHASPRVTLAMMVFFAVSAITLVPVTTTHGEVEIEEPVKEIVANVAQGPQTETKKTVAPKKTYAASTSDCEQYRGLIEQYDWPIETAMQICRDESRGYPEAFNQRDRHYADRAHTQLICVGSGGLFQVACFWPKKLGYESGKLYDPAANIAMAYQIWKKQGWTPWSTYKG